MIDKLCIIGHPSKLGGADTELDHQIHIWQKLGIQVYILHTGDLDENCRNMKMEDRGCIYLKSRDWAACKGMPVISYCNGEYLKNLEEIRKHASLTIFVNCMTWIFDEERKAMKKQLIDVEIYQREAVALDHMAQHSKSNPNVRGYVVRPFFDTSRFPFIDPKFKSTYKWRMGKLHREDLYKLHPETVSIFDRVFTPNEKEVFIMGVNKEGLAKLGTVPQWMTCLPAATMSAQEFYKTINVLVHPADPSQTENLPRVGFEAMASGIPLVVDSRGGWLDLVEHGKTGFLCKTPKEFSYYSTILAFEPNLYSAMAFAARNRVESLWGEERALSAWGKLFNEL